MSQCSEVLIFLLLQISSRPLWVKLSDIHDLKLQILRAKASCLHSTLGVTSRLLGYLECN
jgi:hypothetical protein